MSENNELTMGTLDGVHYCTDLIVVCLIYFIPQQTFVSVNAKDSKCKATGDLPFVLENYNNNK